MNEITIQVCSKEDLDLLAQLNKQLIEDENHDNRMTIEQLKARMEEFIGTDYTAYLFKIKEKTIGYALVNRKREPVYLRQFFICRDSRKNGYGRMAFDMLLELLGTDRLDIEVMYWNERGYGFWKSLGFKERSVYMRFEKDKED